MTDAGYLFERERGVFDDYIEFKLNSSPINSFTVDEISEAISSTVKENIDSSSELLSAAIFALGQSFSKQYKELYLEVMRSS